MTGQGSVDLDNPISTDNLRNLDGFGDFDVEDGDQVVKTDVDGQKKMRSVSDFEGKLPLDVSVRYRLDGKTVKPGDIVGSDGKLDVQYTVENITGTPQEVSFDDGKGGTVTKTVDVPIPMVGSLSLVAPPNFDNVASKQANLAGDGKGGTKLSFTMTLFPPIGSTTAVFGYTADITNGVVPRSDISALPVNPLESPTFKTAATSYKGGADTGVELTAGATEIDSNLLKLRDGASDLLAGLIKLRDGASELNAGLAGSAVPGSQQLANGAGELATGLGTLNSGAKRLAEGTGEALAGSKKLDTGAKKLAAGLESAETKAPALIGGLGDLRRAGRTARRGLQQIGGRPDQATQPLFDGSRRSRPASRAGRPTRCSTASTVSVRRAHRCIGRRSSRWRTVSTRTVPRSRVPTRSRAGSRVLGAVKSGTLPPGAGQWRCRHLLAASGSRTALTHSPGRAGTCPRSA